MGPAPPNYPSAEGGPCRTAPAEQARFEALEQITPGLVSLEAFCRQRNLDQVAAHLDAALLVVEQEMNRLR